MVPEARRLLDGHGLAQSSSRGYGGPQSLSLDDLSRFETHEVISQPSPRRGGIMVPGRNYSGVLLWDLREAAGPIVDPNINEDIMRKVVVARSADGNTAVVAPAVERVPRFIASRSMVGSSAAVCVITALLGR